MSEHTKYVLGFMFSPNLESVALIRKNHPEWQAGKLNGLGGKIRKGEAASAAMCREFKEEAGAETGAQMWRHYGRLFGDGFSVELYAAQAQCSLIDGLRTTTEETVFTPLVSAVLDGSIVTVDNAPWLISAAVNHLRTGRPAFIEARYA